MEAGENKQSGPERRRGKRVPPAEPIGVSHVLPVQQIPDAQVINISAAGVALRTRNAQGLKPGTRLSFSTRSGLPPVLAEVLAVEAEADGYYRIRCRCLMGGFEV